MVTSGKNITDTMMSSRLTTLKDDHNGIEATEALFLLRIAI